jgi:hypothetical protein
MFSGSARTRGRKPICVRTYIIPICVHYFCSFSHLPLVEVVGFALQHPFWLAKGKEVTSILKGIPLRFLQRKTSRIVCTLLMLVYSVVQVFMWRFSSVAAEEIEDRFREFAGIMASSGDGADHLSSTSLVLREGTSTASGDGRDRRGPRTPQALNEQITKTTTILAEVGCESVILLY